MYAYNLATGDATAAQSEALSILSVHPTLDVALLSLRQWPPASLVQTYPLTTTRQTIDRGKKVQQEKHIAMPPKKAAHQRRQPPKKAVPKTASKRGRAEPSASAPAKAAKAVAASTTASCTVRPPFYIIQLIEGVGGRFAYFTRWGRVGEVGQQALVEGTRVVAEQAFERKFKDKTKNDWKTVRDNHAAFEKASGKYDLVETDNTNSDGAAAAVATSATEASGGEPSKLPPQLQSILKVIFNKDMFKAKMKEQNIDANRMPLGKLTKSQVERGYEALEAIETVINKRTRSAKDTAELETLSPLPLLHHHSA
ncbi:protein mono-ADP-ribosyltransferase PARP3-like [Bactrocera neohumeralis]|uniref:protein mono-ADP-ribosyltransferase PARP3-like n=1 Tax=Bactrocera neohumeralis TaxID=98809 RepID=UPI0021664B7D|nr:protein mono-ADP-ribosyltransferase PARP3-like [Bactrocera neohumeralis]